LFCKKAKRTKRIQKKIFKNTINGAKKTKIINNQPL